MKDISREDAARQLVRRPTSRAEALAQAADDKELVQDRGDDPLDDAGRADEPRAVPRSTRANSGRSSRRQKRSVHKGATEKDPNDLRPEDFVAARVTPRRSRPGRTEDE